MITSVIEIGAKDWIINHLGKNPVNGGTPAKDKIKMIKQTPNNLEGSASELIDEFIYKKLFQNKDIKGIEIKT